MVTGQRFEPADRLELIEAVRGRSRSAVPALARTCKTFRNRRPQWAPTGHLVGEPTPIFRGRLRSAVVVSCLSRRSRGDRDMNKPCCVERHSCGVHPFGRRRFVFAERRHAVTIAGPRIAGNRPVLRARFRRRTAVSGGQQRHCLSEGDLWRGVVGC